MSRPEFLKVPDRARYYEAIDSWADDRAEAAAGTRRIAWIVAGVAGAIALVEGVALAALIPLHTTIPYVVSVDRRTGQAELTQRLLPGGTLPERDAVIQSALVQYVLARETYDPADLADKFRRVQLWSDAATARAYVAQMARSNPASPLNRFAGSATQKVVVTGVTLIDRDTALVRFDTQRVDPASASGPMQSFSATVDFRFSGEPMRMEDRYINPLGFQVTHYRRDEDGPAATTAPAADGFAP